MRSQEPERFLRRPIRHADRIAVRPPAEELVSICAAARRLGLAPPVLLARLARQEVVCFGQWRLELRQTRVVALQRLPEVQ